MVFDVVMPKMGESIIEGTILEWRKKVGDSIEVDETLLEIGTDKVDSEIPSPVSGKVVRLLAEPKDVIEVGRMKYMFPVGIRELYMPLLIKTVMQPHFYLLNMQQLIVLGQPGHQMVKVMYMHTELLPATMLLVNQQFLLPTEKGLQSMISVEQMS